MIRYYEESIDRKDHFCETTDPKKASHFCLNGGFKQPIADLKYTTGGEMPPAEMVSETTEPLTLPTANYDEQNKSEQKPNVSNDGPLEMPTMNFDEENQPEQQQNADGPLSLPTMNFDQKKQQKKNQQQQNVTDDDSEPLTLPSL